MTPSIKERIDDLFAEALDLDAGQRQAFLEKACGDTATLPAAVSALLADHDRAEAAGFLNQPLSSAGGSTITDLSNQLTSNVTESSSQATSVANGLTSYQNTLQGQQLAVSGVNIDEETVSMLSYQRAYQASAKYISTINQLPARFCRTSVVMTCVVSADCRRKQASATPASRPSALQRAHSCTAGAKVA